MKFDTNKDKGRAGLSAAIAYYGLLGYTVSLPLNDTQDYDLIVDDGAHLFKVQVKATGSLSRSSNSPSYVVSLQCAGGTAGGVYAIMIEQDFDTLFVFSSERDVWEIPLEVIKAQGSTRSLVVRTEKSPFVNKKCLDTTKYYKGKL